MNAKKFYLICFFIGLAIGSVLVEWLLAATGFAILALVTGLSGRIKSKRLRGLLLPVLLMIGLIVFLTFHQEARAISGGDSKQELIAMLCVGLVVLIVGAVIIVSLKKMCDRINPPPKKENPPENPPATNAPPRYEGPITLTGGVPANTPRFEFDDTAASFWDISDYSATNAALLDPLNQPYLLEFRYQFRTSTNLITWTTNSIHGYVSPTLMHIAIGTNSMIVPRQYRPILEIGVDGAPAAFFQPVP